MNTKEQIAKQCVYLCLMDKLTPQRKIDCIIDMLDTLEREIKELATPKIKSIENRQKIYNIVKKKRNWSMQSNRLVWIHAKAKIMQKRHKNWTWKKCFKYGMNEWNER